MFYYCPTFALSPNIFRYSSFFAGDLGLSAVSIKKKKHCVLLSDVCFVLVSTFLSDRHQLFAGDLDLSVVSIKTTFFSPTALAIALATRTLHVPTALLPSVPEPSTPVFYHFLISDACYPYGLKFEFDHSSFFPLRREAKHVFFFLLQ